MVVAMPPLVVRRKCEMLGLEQGWRDQQQPSTPPHPHPLWGNISEKNREIIAFDFFPPNKLSI